MALAQRTSLIASAWLGVLPVSAAPERPLQERLDAAPVGAVIEVSPGAYHGRLVIRKPVSLVGRGRPAINGGGKGSVVTILADDVTVRGFLITGSGADLMQDDAGIFVQASRAAIESNRIENALHGVYLKKAKDGRLVGNRITGMTTLPGPAKAASSAADTLDMCAPVARNINIRGNGIHLWNSSGVLIERNRITESRDGIYFSFSDECVVRRNVIRKVRYGLHYMYSDRNRFEENHFTESAAGAAMMYSKGLAVSRNIFEANRGFRAYGLLLSAVDRTRIEHNRIVSNNVGIYMENSNGNLFLRNDVAGNYIGIRLTASSDDNRFSRNRFRNNLHPAELAGVSGTNNWSAGGTGNYWQHAAPVDLDGDGVGELPHRQADTLGKLRESFPLVSLLSGSPALELLEFAQQQVELPGLSAIEDPAPLVAPSAAAPPAR